MDYTANQKYFRKKSMVPLIIAGILAVGGFLSFYFAMTSLMYQGGIVIMVIGLIFVIFTLASSTAPSILDDHVDKKIKEYSQEFESIFKPVTKGRVLTPYIIGDYLTDSTELRIKKGRDSRYRSESYEMVWIMVENRKLTIGVKTFSLIEDKFQTSFNSYRYDEIGSVEIGEKTLNLSEKEAVKFHELTIIATNGNIILKTPVKNDVTIDEIKEKIELNKAQVLKEAGEQEQ